MSKQIPTIWTTGTTEIFDTGTWRSALPVFSRGLSPCSKACPVNSDISTWIQHIKNKAFKDAWLTLIKNNPFPSVTGRICHHPCQGSCNRGEYDEAISICDLERYIGDMALEKGWKLPPPKKEHDKKIAVIGGGPSGLSVAYFLRQLGFQVTIFEQHSELGGLLCFGIPSYRLPKFVLSEEIKRLLNLGIKTSLNTSISSYEEIEKLCTQYDAVYLAIGAQKDKKVSQLDYNKKWVIEGSDYLSGSKNGKIPSTGENFVVIGGGSAAVDVARTARRQGKNVCIMSLEKQEELPAQASEVTEAMEEGIRLIDGSMIISADSTEKNHLTLNCVKVDFKRGPKPGQIISIPIPETDFVVDADTIISAIGQDLDISILGEIKTDGLLIKINDLFQTSRKALFAGGDAVSYDRFVSNAIGTSRKTALSIIRLLDLEMQKADNEIKEPVSFDQINTYYHSQASCIQKALIPLTERQNSFDDVYSGITENQALYEAERCFSCGNCIKCNNCYYYCPDMAVDRGGSEADYSVRIQYCKGCGLCVNECPTGSIILIEEIR